MKRENDDIRKINDEIERIIGENDAFDEKEVFEDSGDTKKINSIDEIDTETTFNEEILEDIEEDISKKSVSLKQEENALDEVKENVLEKEKKNKKKLIIIITIVMSIVVVVAIVFTLYFLSFNKKEVGIENDEKLSASEQKEILNNYGETLEGIIAAYYQKQNVLLDYKDAIKLVEFDDDVECKIHEIYEDGLVYLDKCTINEEKTVYSYGKKQKKKEEPTVKEGDIKVYVNKSSKEATLNTPKYLENYDVYSFNINGAYSELTLLDKKKSSYVFYYDSDYNVHMLDYKTGNRVLSNVNYKAVLPIMKEDSFDINMIGVNINDKWGIYNLNTGNCVIYPKYDLISLNLKVGASGPPLYATALEGNKLSVIRNGLLGVIDYTNDSEIIPIIYRGMIKSGDYLLAVSSEDTVHILDYNGNEYLKDTYNKIYDFIDGKYVLVNDNNEIKLVKITGHDIYNYGRLELGDYIYGLPYHEGALFNFYKISGNYSECLEIIYDSSKKKGEVKDSYCGEIG